MNQTKNCWFAASPYLLDSSYDKADVALKANPLLPGVFLVTGLVYDFTIGE